MEDQANDGLVEQLGQPIWPAIAGRAWSSSSADDVAGYRLVEQLGPSSTRSSRGRPSSPSVTLRGYAILALLSRHRPKRSDL